MAQRVALRNNLAHRLHHNYLCNKNQGLSYLGPWGCNTQNMVFAVAVESFDPKMEWMADYSEAVAGQTNVKKQIQELKYYLAA